MSILRTNGPLNPDSTNTVVRFFFLNSPSAKKTSKRTLSAARAEAGSLGDASKVQKLVDRNEIQLELQKAKKTIEVSLCCLL